MTDDKQAKLATIRNLFARAADQAGTPEAETALAMAAKMLAKYGIDEAEARQRAGAEPAEIRLAVFDFAGRYQSTQRDLLIALASALHCTPLIDNCHRDAKGRVMVWGTDNHITRLRMLWAVLMPQMIAGANRVRPGPDSRVGIKACRTSWMRGFYKEIARRLREAESTAAAESDVPGMSLVLVNDAARAQQQMRAYLDDNNLQLTHPRRKFTHDSTAANMGRAAGARANIGQTSVGSRRALGQ